MLIDILYLIKISLLNSIGGPTFFSTKNNIGSYMKALSTNYKPVFIELKNLIYFLRCCNYIKSFKHINSKFLGSIFLEI